MRGVQGLCLLSRMIGAACLDCVGSAREIATSGLQGTILHDRQGLTFAVMGARSWLAGP